MPLQQINNPPHSYRYEYGGRNTPLTNQYGVTSVLFPRCNEIFQISNRDETNTLSSKKYVAPKAKHSRHYKVKKHLSQITISRHKKKWGKPFRSAPLYLVDGVVAISARPGGVPKPKPRQGFRRGCGWPSSPISVRQARYRPRWQQYRQGGGQRPYS